MARKNKNAGSQAPRLNLPKNTHLMYTTDELFEDATVVRYLGEQDDDMLLVFHPEGFPLWVHLTHVWVPRKKVSV